MKYAVVYTYPPDKELIQRARPDHRAYLGGLRERGKLAAAGPFTDDSGALIIYEADSEDEAKQLIQSDPFHAAGVFARYQIYPWNQVF
ncbi:MAG TPA: YciI family protein [Dehalococcoidia bacterium]|nr:YciI family protein [Dehalococcoidia bacterium]